MGHSYRKMDKKDTIDAYSSSELVTQYEGSTMAGEYVWEENYDLKVRDIQIFVEMTGR